MIAFTEKQLQELDNACANRPVQKDVFLNIYDENGKACNYQIRDIGRFRNVNDAEFALIVSLENSNENAVSTVQNLKSDLKYILSMCKKHANSADEKFVIVLNFNEIENHTEKPKYLHHELTLGALSNMEHALKEQYNVDFYYSEYCDKVQNITGYQKAKVFWNLDQVKRANLAIKRIVDIVERNKLSPLEAVAYISVFAYKNLSYNDSTFFGKVGFEADNTIVSAVNNGHVRCVGYDQFFSAISIGLKDYFLQREEELLPESQNIVYTTRDWTKGYEGHRVSKTQIKDKKYGVCGSFLVDIADDMVNLINRPIEDSQNFLDRNKLNKEKLTKNTFERLKEKCVFTSLLFTDDSESHKNRVLRVKEKYVTDEVSVDCSPKLNAVLFGIPLMLKTKPLKGLNLSNKSNLECKEIIDRAYQGIKNLKIPTLEDLLEQNYSCIEKEKI